jgi:glycosyltransferase involved in cell wall biosynthesis
MSTPAVSVIIPCYNHRDTVAAALQSALAQTFTDREIIVINDGSPDDTAEVLRPYVDRIRYYEQANAGQAVARNRGIELSRGEFIALLDDDDTWPEDKLAWQVELMRARPEIVLVYGEDVRVDREGRVLPPTPRRGYKRPSGRVHGDFLEGCWIASPGQTLIRRSALERIGGFDAQIWGSDDWDLYLRLAKVGQFHYENRLALNYRVHGGAASTNVLRHLAGHDRAARKHPAQGLRAWRRWRNAAAYFGTPLLRLSHELRRAGDFTQSLRAQRAALRFDPLLLFRGEWLVPVVLNLARRPVRERKRVTH